MGERIGVIGIGRMGSRIVRTLVEAGFETSVFDIIADRGHIIGAQTARDASALAAHVDTLITVLPGTAELENVMRTAFESLRPGTLWLDFTSLDPAVADRLAVAAASRTIDAVGAPMAGGPTSASLGFFVGGCSAAVARARPILQTLGTVDHVGEKFGDGYTAKLLANLLWFGQVAAVTEAMLLGISRGLTPQVLHRTLAASAGGSAFVDDYLGRLLEGDYAQTFGLDRCVEELNALVALADSAAIPFELSTLIANLHRQALQQFGAVNGEMLAAKLLEERAGFTLRPLGG